MDYVNQMQDRILSEMQSIADSWQLEWVRIISTPSQGVIRLIQAGQFQTLLKIEYEFQAERFALLIYRDGKHSGGRCNINYDDGAFIEQMLAQFRCLRPATVRRPSQVDPFESCLDLPERDFTLGHDRLSTLIRSLGLPTA